MTIDQRARKDTPGTDDAAVVYPPRPVVLAIDDEPGVRESLRLILAGEFEVLEAADGAAALAILGARRVDVALLDVRMPGQPGSRVLPQIRAIDESIPVILITADPHLRMAVDAMKAGAYDYLAKPFDVDELLDLVREAAQQRGKERELDYLRAEMDRAHGFDQLVGRHPRMVKLYELIARVSQTHAAVLITAETGTGKELVARAIHNQGPRRAQPFVAVNLAAIPDTLLESELFGHEKGAFTGAHTRKPGKFELAHGGTLFLDEVGSLRIDLQAKLLRALQEREIERLGGTRTIQVDVRIIAATNSDLREAIRARTFREDLYYRLHVVPVGVPPLRERKSDLPALAAHFVRKYAGEFKKDVRGLSRGARMALERYDWPGNVRELENIIERSVALATRPVIGLDDLPLDLAMNEVAPARGEGEPGPLTLREARDRFEQAFVLRTLERENWNESRAARSLGVHRNTLLARLQAWGFQREEPGAGPGKGRASGAGVS